MSLDDTLDDSLAEWMYGCRVPNSGVLVREAEFSAQLFHVSVRIMEKIEKTITNPGDADRIVEYCGMLWNKYRHVYFIYIYIYYSRMVWAHTFTLFVGKHLLLMEDHFCKLICRGLDRAHWH